VCVWGGGGGEERGREIGEGVWDCYENPPFLSYSTTLLGGWPVAVKSKLVGRGPSKTNLLELHIVFNRFAGLCNQLAAVQAAIYVARTASAAVVVHPALLEAADASPEAWAPGGGTDLRPSLGRPLGLLFDLPAPRGRPPGVSWQPGRTRRPRRAPPHCWWTWATTEGLTNDLALARATCPAGGRCAVQLLFSPLYALSWAVLPPALRRLRPTFVCALAPAPQLRAAVTAVVEALQALGRPRGLPPHTCGWSPTGSGSATARPAAWCPLPRLLPTSTPPGPTAPELVVPDAPPAAVYLAGGATSAEDAASWSHLRLVPEGVRAFTKSDFEGIFQAHRCHQPPRSGCHRPLCVRSRRLGLLGQFCFDI
jgi:hypothetical protein